MGGDTEREKRRETHRERWGERETCIHRGRETHTERGERGRGERERERMSVWLLSSASLVAAGNKKEFINSLEEERMGYFPAEGTGEDRVRETTY